MNRDDFEWLMEHSRSRCAEYLPGPPNLPIEEDKWNKWLAAGIVSDPELFKDVEIPKRGLVRRPWVYYKAYHEFIIYNDNNPFQDSREEVVTKPIELYKLDLIKLLEYMAKIWGLHPDIRKIKYYCITLGWREGNQLVIFYAEQDYDGWVGEGYLDEIKTDERADILYVINIGETQLLLGEVKDLASKGIINIGSNDFLSDDGQPRWDLFKTPAIFQPPLINGQPTYGGRHEERRDKRIEDLIPFRTPQGMTWEQITIEFVKDDLVRITAGSECIHATHEEMGFGDHRKIGKPPIVTWVLLKQFAKLEGELGWKDTAGKLENERDKMKKWISELRKQLQLYFGIKDDPFEPYRAERRYQTKFAIRYNVVDDLR